MQSPGNIALICALLIGACSPSWCAAPPAAAKGVATIRRMALLGGSGLEVEIAASEPVTGQAQLLTGPNRLVIDFPNAVPGPDLHTLTVNRGEIKDIRVGVLRSSPPVTRVVLDLKTPLRYQLFPSGKTVIVKLTGGSHAAAAAVSGATPLSFPAQPVAPAARVEVHFHNGKLSIWANKATLAEVLTEVHRQTGADIPIPAGADQEQVVADFRAAPARDVLAALLNGSRFNFIMVGSDRNPTQLRSVMLTPRGNAVPQTIAYTPPAPVAQIAPDPVQPPEQPEATPDQKQPGDAPEPQR